MRSFLLALLSIIPVSAAGDQESACLAANIYYEARGDGFKSQMMVGLVTANRATHSGASLCEVVFKRKQFSWTSTHPARPRPANAVERRALLRAKLLAKNILLHMRAGRLEAIDFTNGATHYHAEYVSPYWSNSLRKLGVAGTHIYYADARRIRREQEEGA